MPIHATSLPSAARHSAAIQCLRLLSVAVSGGPLYGAIQQISTVILAPDCPPRAPAPVISLSSSKIRRRPALFTATLSRPSLHPPSVPARGTHPLFLTHASTSAARRRPELQLGTYCRSPPVELVAPLQAAGTHAKSQQFPASSSLEPTPGSPSGVIALLCDIDIVCTPRASVYLG